LDNANFIDHVKICCRSGAGGAGVVHFRREKFVPKGGPDGGDGGRGGHIILKGNKQRWTLLDLKYRKHVIAKPGQPGAGSCKTGHDGKDVILDVPLGTVIKNAETGEVELEITVEEETEILVAGGRGGRGNTHFKSSTHQTPTHAQPGEPGKNEWKILELKLLADVGLVGFPNAGKSTLLSVMSAAKPKIADYPFTTLTPQLGMVPYHDHQSFVMADIPGIIEDAHKGKGLGQRFLRHIERNSILLLLIPVDSPDIKKEYEVLLNELKQYNPKLLKKNRILAISKADLADEDLKALIKDNLPDIPTVFISSIKNQGIAALKDLIMSNVKCMMSN